MRRRSSRRSREPAQHALRAAFHVRPRRVDNCAQFTHRRLTPMAERGEGAQRSGLECLQGGGRGFETLSAHPSPRLVGPRPFREPVENFDLDPSPPTSGRGYRQTESGRRRYGDVMRTRRPRRRQASPDADRDATRQPGFSTRRAAPLAPLPLRAVSCNAASDSPSTSQRTGQR